MKAMRAAELEAPAGAPLLRLAGLAKRYGAAEAVAPVDLAVARGDFCAILGPSGCGKSTLLRMIAGLVEPSAGAVEIDGADVTRLGPERRPTNMVFQGYGLFPHLSVAENVGFGLALRRVPPAERAARVEAALRLVQLDGFGPRAIDRLSGGQQQRVALARALILRPKVLLLDEPLAALDLKLRLQMQEELRRIHREIGGTFLFVTHDQGEAFALANRVVVMNAGRVEQIGSPAEVYRAPATLFVADFVGETTILEGERRDGRVRLRAGPILESLGPDGPVRAVIRPERIRLDPAGVAAAVEDVQFLGASLKLVARLDCGEALTVRLADAAGAGLAPGARARFGWDEGDLRVLEPP
jgi:ABC-type Fe3+/spermidine/putrescine transport system ATPase subunit